MNEENSHCFFFNVRYKQYVPPILFDASLDWDNKKGNSEVRNALVFRLKELGYMSTNESSENEVILESSLQCVQKQFHVAESGKLDRKTLEILYKPRIDTLGDTSRTRISQRNGLPSCITDLKWPKQKINYAFKGFTDEELLHCTLKVALRESISAYQEISCLEFKEIEWNSSVDMDNVDILIEIVSTLKEAREQVGIIGETKWRWNKESGQIQKASITISENEAALYVRSLVTDDYHWQQPHRTAELFNLFTRQIGHCIGLDNSKNPMSPMFPTLNPIIKNLSSSDIHVLKQKYAPQTKLEILPYTTEFEIGVVSNFHGKTFLAWTGNDRNHRIRVLSLPDSNVEAQRDHFCPQYFSSEESKTVMLSEGSERGVSMCEFNGKLYIAFLSLQPEGCIVLISSPDGKRWNTCKRNLSNGMKAIYTPSLTVHHEHLILSWTDQRGRMYIENSKDGEFFGGRKLIQCSASLKDYDLAVSRPSLASFRGHLYVSWIGTNIGRNLYVMRSVDWGASWNNKLIVPPGEGCIAGPTLYSSRPPPPQCKKLTLLWVGADHRIRMTDNETSYKKVKLFEEKTTGTPTSFESFSSSSFWIAYTGIGLRKHITLLNTETRS